MLYAKIQLNQVKQIANIHSLFPNEQFAFTGPTQNFLETNDVMLVVDYLEHDIETQKLEFVDPFIQDGKVYVCIVRDMTDEEKSIYQQQKIQHEWDKIRIDRNSKLMESDWTQLPDSPVSQYDWAEYRQKLRNITTQTDPFNIDWPTKP